MNVWKLVFLCCFASVLPAFGESFLSAQSFPKTSDDLSFTAKLDLKADDYEYYQPVYDKNTGMCIKNCAYYGLTIKQEEELIDQNTEDALNQEYEQQNTGVLSLDARTILNNVVCANRNDSIPVGQRKPLGEPVKGRPRITSPYDENRVIDGEPKPHRAIDYGVPAGTIVYSTADGIVIGAWNERGGGECGMGIKIQHANGLKTVYCHLSKLLVGKGSKIGAGCPIALSGNTGYSTGDHLHYAIKDVNDRPVRTYKFTGRRI